MRLHASFLFSPRTLLFTLLVSCTSEAALSSSSVSQQAAGSMIDPSVHPHLSKLASAPAPEGGFDQPGSEFHTALHFSSPHFTYLPVSGRWLTAVAGENPSGEVAVIGLKSPRAPKSGEAPYIAQAWERVIATLVGASSPSDVGVDARLVKKITDTFEISKVTEAPGVEQDQPWLALIVKAKRPFAVDPRWLLDFHGLQALWEKFASDPATPGNRDVPQFYSRADLFNAMNVFTRPFRPVEQTEAVRVD